MFNSNNAVVELITFIVSPKNSWYHKKSGSSPDFYLNARTPKFIQP